MDRRSFLVQSARMMGAVLTASFVTRVEAYVEHKNSPLLLPPSRKKTEFFMRSKTLVGDIACTLTSIRWMMLSLRSLGAISLSIIGAGVSKTG